MPSTPRAAPTSLTLRPEFWITLVAIVSYLPSVAGGFVYDDIALIRDNAYVHDLSTWSRAFGTHFWDVPAGTPDAGTVQYYRPLVTLSYLLNWLASSGQAWAFHLTNVLIHGTNTLLALRVGTRFARSASIGTACALLFALHPTRAEAVTWISGRPDVLMTFFLLLAVEAAHVGRQRSLRVVATAGVVLGCSAALLCKEPALAAPFLVGLGAVDAPLRQRRWHQSMLAVTAVLGAAYVALRHLYLPFGTPALVWTPTHFFVTVAHYFERLAFPWPLTFFYEVEQLGPAGPIHSPGDVIGGVLLILSGVALCALACRRDRGALLLLLGSAAFMGPLLNVVYTSSKVTTADRFLYLPLWLLALGLGRLFSPLAVRLLESRRACLLGSGALSIYVALNVVRTVDFTSSLTLWNAELALNPDNPVALRGRAGYQLRHGNLTLAIPDIAGSLTNESLRYYTLATPEDNGEAYAQLIALRAQSVPDGADSELRALAADAVDRLAGRRRLTRSPFLVIDWPKGERSVAWLATQGEGALALTLVPLTTRLELQEISRSLLDAIPDERLHLALNPLMIPLGEAREERFDHARRRIDALRQRSAIMPSVVTPAAIADIDAQISAAERDFSASKLMAKDERHLARARAFATLGAYGRALRETQQVPPSHPDMLPLHVQLLMFARLDATALRVATQALGAERARSTIEGIRGQLPESLRNLPPAGPPQP